MLRGSSIEHIRLERAQLKRLKAYHESRSSDHQSTACCLKDRLDILESKILEHNEQMKKASKGGKK